MYYLEAIERGQEEDRKMRAEVVTLRAEVQEYRDRAEKAGAKLARVKDVAVMLVQYPDESKCSTCGQPDTDIAGGLMKVRAWQNLNNWNSCGNVWHNSQELRRESRKRVAILSIIDEVTL